MFDKEEKWGIVLPSPPYPKCGKMSWKNMPDKKGPCDGTLLPRTKPTEYSRVDEYGNRTNNLIDIAHPTIFWRCNLCGDET